MYMTSLLTLFPLLALESSEIPDEALSNANTNTWMDIFKANFLASMFSIATLIGLWSYIKLSLATSNSSDIPFTAINVEPVNQESMSFLATYVIPTACLDFSGAKQTVISVSLIIMLGILYARTDMFYANPSLTILGFNTYKCSGKFKHGQKDKIILICRGEIVENQKIAYIKLDEKIYFAKRGQK